MEGVFCHFQIIEDEAGLAVEFAHGGGDAVGFGANDADGEASQSGGVLGAVAGSDATAVLLPAAVEDVMGGLDGPVPAVQCPRFSASRRSALAVLGEWLVMP